MESVRAAFSKAVREYTFIYQVDIGTFLLRCTRGTDDPNMFSIPFEALGCTKQWTNLIPELKACMYGLRAAYES